MKSLWNLFISFLFVGVVLVGGFFLLSVWQRVEWEFFFKFLLSCGIVVIAGFCDFLISLPHRGEEHKVFKMVSLTVFSVLLYLGAGFIIAWIFMKYDKLFLIKSLVSLGTLFMMWVILCRLSRVNWDEHYLSFTKPKETKGLSKLDLGGVVLPEDESGVDVGEPDDDSDVELEDEEDEDFDLSEIDNPDEEDSEDSSEKKES